MLSLLVRSLMQGRLQVYECFFKMKLAGLMKVARESVGLKVDICTNFSRKHKERLQLSTDCEKRIVLKLCLCIVLERYLLKLASNKLASIQFHSKALVLTV